MADLPYESGDRVALMINGLGGTPISELYIAYGHAHEQLEKRGIRVARSYVGEYCTSLDMAGASLTLVRLDDEIEGLLAAPAEAGVKDLLARRRGASRFVAQPSALISREAHERPSQQALPRACWSVCNGRERGSGGT